MSRVLIVEDEPHMQQGLKDNLEFEGYTVVVAGDGATGLRLLTDEAFDLVLLDVMLPALSGFDVCRQARQRGVATPIIMLTARGDEIDTVRGLELGADDYITKPFSLRELLARVKAVLRRHAPPATATFRVGRLEVDPDAYVARLDGAETPLSHLEFEVLKYLWAHRNQTVSRDALLADVWGYGAGPTTRTVDNFILKLRQKIEPDPSAPRHILTVHGLGYKLVAAP